jgi:hypothetical protein
MNLKDKRIEYILNIWAESIDLKDLIHYFKDNEQKYLKSLSNDEIKQLFKSTKGY